MADTQNTPAAPGNSEPRIAQLPPLPPGELGEKMAGIYRRDLIDFMNAIEKARAVWAACPQLVTAETLDWIPAEMWAAFRKEYTHPSDREAYDQGRLLDGFQGDGLLQEDYPARLRACAEETLAKEAAKRQKEEPEIETGNHAPASWFETDDLNYALEMDHDFNDESFLERIMLSRDEYVAAKTLVAGMRGVKAEPEAKAA